MANKGGYLGGSTIIRVHPKRSNTSKNKEKKRKTYNANLAKDWAVYKAKLELPTQSSSPTNTPPSKAGKKKSERILKELGPIIRQIREIAHDFSKITGEPSCLVEDIAIYEVQNLTNMAGVKRSLSGFDGWLNKKRVRAVGGILPKASEDANVTPIAINGLDQGWDELCLVLFDDLYNTHSILSVSKNKLCDVTRDLGRKNKSPSFVLPLSVLLNISDSVSGNKPTPTKKKVVEGEKKRTRYIRTT